MAATMVTLLITEADDMKKRIPNPHNFVPACFDPRTIAIIGGKGSMGRRLAEEFFKDGYNVRLTGEEPLTEIGPTSPRVWTRAVRRWNENVCKGADVVVFSVPIALLSERDGLSRIFGHTPPRGWRDKLVIDICSTKIGPTQALSELKGASVIGTHPMFGPKLRSLAGQTVFVCPVARSDDNHVLHARRHLCLKWLKDFWARRGVQVIEVSPDEHDSFMPAVQFGVLLSILLYAEGLRQTGASLNQVQHRGTPNSRVLCTRLARMISPAMLSTYVNLAFDNPHNRKWLEVTMESLIRLQGWMVAGDREGMLAWLQNLAASQPSHFQAHFGDVSVFLDECLAKREFLAACLAQESRMRMLLDDAATNARFAHVRAA